MLPCPHWPQHLPLHPHSHPLDCHFRNSLSGASSSSPRHTQASTPQALFSTASGAPGKASQHNAVSSSSSHSHHRHMPCYRSHIQQQRQQYFCTAGRHVGRHIGRQAGTCDAQDDQQQAKGGLWCTRCTVMHGAAAAAAAAVNHCKSAASSTSRSQKVTQCFLHSCSALHALSWHPPPTTPTLLW